MNENNENNAISGILYETANPLSWIPLVGFGVIMWLMFRDWDLFQKADVWLCIGFLLAQGLIHYSTITKKATQRRLITLGIVMTILTIATFMVCAISTVHYPPLPPLVSEQLYTCGWMIVTFLIIISILIWAWRMRHI